MRAGYCAVARVRGRRGFTTVRGPVWTRAEADALVAGLREELRRYGLQAKCTVAHSETPVPLGAS